jgi:putative transposase
LVDHLGLLISAAISVGNCGDRDGLKVLLYLSKRVSRCPEKVWADYGYHGVEFQQEIKSQGVNLEIVKRRDCKLFRLEAKRWIVERTFAWLGKCRRLSKDYELITSSSLSMIYLAMSRLVVRRIACLV